MRVGTWQVALQVFGCSSGGLRALQQHGLACFCFPPPLPPCRRHPPVLPALLRTSVWLILSSVALKKWGEAWGPITKVMFLCASGMVNTSPCFLYISSISGSGPCREARAARV